jgi:Flp pilus assembly protein TadG
MLNNKGQALVEFIIIIPVFMFLALGVIDFGNILYQKYTLENDLDLVTDLHKQDKINDINSYISNKNITYNYNNEGNLTTIILSKPINVMTPGLNLVLGNTYVIKAERVVYNEG